MSNLYFIKNMGCDDETCGLARIPDEFIETFKSIIEDLNENSTNCCMPEIVVYKIDESMIREATDIDKDYKILHLGDKKYVLVKSIRTYKGSEWSLAEGVERVI